MENANSAFFPSFPSIDLMSEITFLTPAINKRWRKYEPTNINIAELVEVLCMAHIEHSFRSYV